MGLGRKDVGGVAAASIDYYMPTLTLVEQLAIEPTFVDSTSLGGCSFLTHLEHAMWAVERGTCDVVLIAYGATPRSDPRNVHRLSELSSRDSLRFALPSGAFARMAARHMHIFGTTAEQLATIPVNARRWSAITPGSEKPALSPSTTCSRRRWSVRPCMPSTAASSATALPRSWRQAPREQRTLTCVRSVSLVSRPVEGNRNISCAGDLSRRQERSRDTPRCLKQASRRLTSMWPSCTTPQRSPSCSLSRILGSAPKVTG